MPTNNEAKPTRKRRFQFHLSTAVVLMIVAGACVGLWIMQRKIEGLEKTLSERDEHVNELENELEFMRREGGYDSMSDVILSRDAPVNGEHAWAWTVYFAKDCQIDVTVDLKNIGGVARTATTVAPVDLKKGMYRVQAEIQRGPDGATVLQLTLPSHAKTAPTREIAIAGKPSDTDWIFYRQSNLRGGIQTNAKGFARLLDLRGVNSAGAPVPEILLELKLK